jgi:two-component system chemotaxis response regulator CheY
MGKKILCIDDSSTIRMLVKKTLVPLDYEVLEAENGKHGLDMAISNQVDLLLVDVNMPVMNGFECVAAVKALPQYAKVPMVFLTTESSQEKKDQGRQLGVSGWIIKPFEPDGLVKILRMLLP